MERLPGINVANFLEKKALLRAINCVAALSIFFFGYDQVSLYLATLSQRSGELILNPPPDVAVLTS